MYKFFKYLRRYDDTVRVVKEIFNVLKNIQNQNNKLKNNKKKIA